MTSKPPASTRNRVRHGILSRCFCFTSLFLLAILACTPGPGLAASLAVPGGFSTIQAALDVAAPGDTVLVAAGTYLEKVHFASSGNATAGPITLQAESGATVVLDGTGVVGSNMVLIESKSYVRVIGFEIRNDLGVNDGSGVRVIGAGSHIEIRNNKIHDIRGRHAMGITVYGTLPDPISDLVIDGNEIYDCEPATSEALTLNGNVTNFEVTNNTVRDVNNIGIDFIGGEADIQPDPTKVARNGRCRGNRVYRARSSYGGGFAAGIYVDGGRDIVVENNTVSQCDLGIEVGAENAGTVATGVVVRNNVLYHNEKVCIVFGGFAPSVGRANANVFTGNSCYQNDTLSAGFGELWISYAADNLVEDNIFYSTAQNLLLYAEQGSVNNSLDYNLWYADAGPAAAGFLWSGTWYNGFAQYRSASGQDAASQFADPQFADPTAADFHIADLSPAVDAGDPGFVAAAGETDLDYAARIAAAQVDIGADETGAGCGDGLLQPSEECDDGNLVDADGCDSNCTVTACGNGILTVASGEQCDDGNTKDGDCCSASCLLEAAGSSCDDGDACTNGDVCDGSGICTGLAIPATGCRSSTRSGGAALLLRDKDADSRDRLVWKWGKGQATSLADFGDPRVDTAYTLCVYDEQNGVPALRIAARAAAGGSCSRKPCWKLAGTRGFRYRDPSALPDGVKSLALKAGADGKARITVKGAGAALAMPALPLSQSPRVTVQMQSSNGLCWEAQYSAPSQKNRPGQFKDKSD